MSGWRVAASLELLRAEINEIAPLRSTKSDGAIGDKAHRASASDHNPNDANVVCARDFTHNPGRGADMHRISRRIVAVLPPALKYVIWDHQIWSRARASEGWRPYSGSNPHTKHMHVSVGRGPDGDSTGPYDDMTPWGLLAAAPKPTAPAATDWSEEIAMALPTITNNKAPKAARKRAQSLLAANGYAPENTFNSQGEPDGNWGPASKAALKRFQAKHRVKDSVLANGEGDGVLGRYSWEALLGV